MRQPQNMKPPTELPTDVVYAGREILGELSLCESRELLLTNGIGGYASHTLAGSLTRSYHGLLIAALRPPLDRTLLLAKLNDEVHYHTRIYHLATDRRSNTAIPPPANPSSESNHLPGADLLSRSNISPVQCGFPPQQPVWNGSEAARVAPNVRPGEVVTPAGFELLESFHLEGTVPVFSYAFADALLDKRIWMKHGQNTVYVTYHLRRAAQAVELRFKALVNHRNHHLRTNASRPHFAYSANLGRTGSTVSVLFTTPERQETTLYMRMSHGKATLTNQWWTGFVLSEERARGLPHLDDNLHVATFVVDLAPGGQVTFVASAELHAAQSVSLDGEAELAMQHAYEKSLLQRFAAARSVALRKRLDMDSRASGRTRLQEAVRWPALSPLTEKRPRVANIHPYILQLVLAADQFIISRGGGRSVVAGFHWFTDWARDVGCRFPVLEVRLRVQLACFNFNLLLLTSLVLLFAVRELFYKQTMISLPGLTIVTGRYDVARSILQTFSKYGTFYVPAFSFLLVSTSSVMLAN